MGTKFEMMSKQETKEIRSFIKSWWFWFFALLIITAIIGFGLNSIGLISKTVVERKVFENSYQYSEARKTAIATYEAQLAEIERKLSNKSLDETTRSNLEASAAGIRIQLTTERSKQ